MKKFIFLSIFLYCFASLNSQTGIPRAQAMFIYNFSRLAEWPATYKTGPFIIGVFGSAETLTELKTFTSGKMVGQQNIQVKRFTSPEEIDKCHILFVPFGKTKQLPLITNALGSKSTLIVSEKNGGIGNGAAINFIIVGDKLKFEIKPSNASSRNLKFSSRLSEMAMKVH